MLSTVANTKMFFHITGAQPFLLFQGCQIRARKAALRFECHAMINRSAAVAVSDSTQSNIRLNAYRACARMRSDRF